MRKLFTPVLLIILCACQLESQAQFRKYSNEFLNIGAGARGLAMGGAQVASVKDGTAGYWNPAGLAEVKEIPQVNLMHAEYFAGIGKYDFASLALPVNNGKRTIGLSILRFAVDNIPNTVFLVEPDGSINLSNITMFSAADYAFLFSMAQQVDFHNSKMNVGMNAKIIHRQAGQFATSWGFGFDAGAQFVSDKWKFGVVARDVTTTFNAWSYNINDKMQEVFYVTNNEIPNKSMELTAPKLITGVGRGFTLSKNISLLAEANMDITFDGRRNTVFSVNPVSIDPKLGIEGSFKNIIFLRAGINNFQKVLDDADINNHKKIWIYQPAIGAGFIISNLQIDYAFTNLANQSNPLYTHIFSLKLDLKEKESK